VVAFRLSFLRGSNDAWCFLFYDISLSFYDEPSKRIDTSESASSARQEKATQKNLIWLHKTAALIAYNVVTTIRLFSEAPQISNWRLSMRSMRQRLACSVAVPLPLVAALQTLHVYDVYFACRSS